MSDLESVISPLARAAIKGSSATFGVSSHETIAKWALKTAMMLDCAYGDLGAGRFIPDSHCHDLCASRTPRHATFVGTTSFGYDPRTQTFRHAWAKRFKLDGIRLSSGDTFSTYVVTFQYGYFVIQAAVLEIEEKQDATFCGVDLSLPDGRTLPAVRFLQQFWPTLNADIQWPPPIGLWAPDLDLWAERSPFLTKAPGHGRMSV